MIKGLDKKTALILLLFGVFFLGMGIFNTFFHGKGLAETTAVIERIEDIQDFDAEGDPITTHETYVRYEVDGKEYHGKSDVYEIGYSVGKEIKIYYDPSNPEKISGDSFKIGIVFMAVGCVIILVGGFAFIKSNKQVV